MKVLVLGAYGLIGSACARALIRREHQVTGLGRSAASAARSGLDIPWIYKDVTHLSPAAWREVLTGFDAVLNASGALQSGHKDDLDAVHIRAVEALCDALKNTPTKLIHISAAGVAEEAPTAFFRSKARGDAVIAATDLEWIILRPTLVLGQTAYGGTALLRGAAGLPFVGVRIFEDVPIQTISAGDLGDAVADCTEGQMPMRRRYDLTEDARHSFGDVVRQMRGWLGFPESQITLPVPGFVLTPLRLGADALGLLGWRAPLRSAALRTLQDGIAGDPAPWRDAGGRSFASLDETLAAMPSTLQERWFSRLYLMFPLAVGVLSVFWVLSGLIGAWQFEVATEVLTARGFAALPAQGFVALGSAADILLGLAILYRPWARGACVGMLAVAGGYLVGASLFAPDLWADPLGPMVKVLPSLALALVVHAMLEPR